VSTARFLIGDTRAVVATLPDNSVDLVLSSPPFLALRSYLDADDPNKGLEIGQEANPAAFLDVLLELTAGWRRVLAPHGSIAIELGDTYSGNVGGFETTNTEYQTSGRSRGRVDNEPRKRDLTGWPLAKSLALVPELYRIALAYGINPLTGATSPAGRWRVRNVVRWHRPNPPVGALGDKYRPSTSDMVIACVSDRRWFDLDAVRTPVKDLEHEQRYHAEGKRRENYGSKARPGEMSHASGGGGSNPAGAPPLDTWVIPTHPYPGSHYATWPPALCVKPIKSMCPEKVCRVCGEPSRRIVEAERTVDGMPMAEWLADRPPARKRAGWSALSEVKAENPTVNTMDAGLNINNNRIGTSRETIGWTDCGCSTDGTHWRAGVVLDPFGGSGTTGAVATGLGRDAILVDLDARNQDLARERIGMFMESA